MSNRQNAWLTVFVVGGGYEYIKLMYDLGYAGAKGIGDADIVLFTGGEDVNPSLYDERPLKQTYFNAMRDEYEAKIFEACLEEKIPMIGICRGGQFLNVMSGGKMWQHVDGHCGPHQAFVVKDGKRTAEITVTSTHHQMMIPGPGAEILMVADESTELLAFDRSVSQTRGGFKDIEALWYPDSLCLCYQPHPELRNASKECRNHFETLLDEQIMPNVNYERGSFVK